MDTVNKIDRKSQENEDLSTLDCNQLGNRLREFMAIGLSNKDISKTDFGTMASWAPFKGFSLFKHEVEEAKKVHHEFMERCAGPRKL